MCDFLRVPFSSGNIIGLKDFTIVYSHIVAAECKGRHKYSIFNHITTVMACMFQGFL